MTIRVNLFAGLRDAAEVNHVTVDVDDVISIADLIDRVADQVPEAAALVRHSRVALDDTYLSNDQTISPGSCCDLIPPVSGG